MKQKLSVLTKLKDQMQGFLKACFHRAPFGPLPLRSPLLSQSQLEDHARLLASIHNVVPGKGPDLLSRRLRENERIIRKSCAFIAQATVKKGQTIPAVEWLMDNLYVIEEQIDAAHEQLPPSYSRELPRLCDGPSRGFPRVYDLALEMVSHTDGAVDMENLTHFIRAYTARQSLKLGELWAVPIMLRIALLENLRRITHLIASQLRDHELAHEWAHRFIDIVHKSPKTLITELADFVRSNPPVTRSFTSELAASLQGEHGGLRLVIDWIEQDLAERGQSIEQMFQAESQNEAANRVSIANSIMSLRTLGGLDWKQFVESLSRTEAILRHDPAGVYAAMDFSSRDRYRHMVEHLAKWSRMSEQEVADNALRLARRGLDQAGRAAKEAHVGFYLADRGLKKLHKEIRYKPPILTRINQWFLRYPAWWYASAVIVMTAIFGGALLALFREAPFFRPLWASCALLAAIIPPASQSALALVNWLVTLAVKTRNLPRLDFSQGIPEEHRTIVAVPAMLESGKEVERLIENLEIRYLANRSANLFFALLTDFPDAPQETCSQDAPLLAQAEQGIRHLNARYGNSNGDIFFLLHRPRLWNQEETCWMGYERKRGKLRDLNRLLQGGPSEAFSVIIGDRERLRTARYVITLDTDTKLPAEAAWKMIGSMAHPLNRPIFNSATDLVESGYGVLQPRVSISLTGALRSRFARLFSGEVGIDPYTREIANVYSDLFAETQFIGKGIYDVAAFDRATGARFPSNRILSHDLIEGCYARCGFLNDMELIEDCPACYTADIYRRHRWIRGDWQIAAWLLAKVPGPEGRRVKNPLNGLAQWWLFDNLRRSLALPGLLLLLVLNWLIPGQAATATMLGIIGIYLLPGLAQTAWAAFRKPRKIMWSAYMAHTMAKEGREVLLTLFHIVFLPYEALVALDAILISLWRTTVSHRDLLKWQTARTMERNSHAGLLATFRETWTEPAFSLICLGFLLHYGASLTASLPYLASWLAAPVLIWFISQPLRRRKDLLGHDEIIFLRKLALRTWMYFKHFMGNRGNWLPPDNFQEHPAARLAERTSPTNIGFALLSYLSACDFGFISAGSLLVGVGRMFKTMEKLERYRGHFLNWYETKTCTPLHPVYVSTVDSGNLTASLITLEAGLRELAGELIISPQWQRGLDDAVAVLRDESARRIAAEPQTAQDFQKLADAMEEDINRLRSTPATLPGIAGTLSAWSNKLSEIAPLARGDSEVDFWFNALSRQCEDMLADLCFLVPWLEGDLFKPPAERPATLSPQSAEIISDLQATLNRIPRLKELATLSLRLSKNLDTLNPADPDAWPDWSRWLKRLREAIKSAGERAAERIRSLEGLALQCDEFAENDLEFLYDPLRKLLAIGYTLETHRRDPSFYDLLASEARVCSFLGIAQGKLTQEHWFNLSRQLTPGHAIPTLMSWSGSMFEYLLPTLFMPVFENTLLDQSCRGAVIRHMRYGAMRRVPWGISESCFNQVDAHMNYQYRAFGVPGLGWKRGLAEDLVVAPYASVMALTVMPREACDNLQMLARQGMIGRFGLYEALDYTPSRLSDSQPYVIVRSFMAHHSGMSLMALAEVLLGHPVQRRFMRHPEMNAASLLLQERMPMHRTAVRPEAGISPQAAEPGLGAREPAVRIFRGTDMPLPEVNLLSNGRYQVAVTNAGSGFSRWQNLALTRWRDDVTQDSWGLFCYVRNTADGDVFSCAYQPLALEENRYETIFSHSKAEFRVLHARIESYMQITVSPEDDIELRRITLTNHTGSPLALDLTTFAEIALVEQRADLAHRAFQSLFVQTEIMPDKTAVLCARRPRSGEESPPCMFQTLLVHTRQKAAPASFETDRARFTGRGRSPARPKAIADQGPLSNFAGAVLDPIIAIRQPVYLAAGEGVTMDVITGIAKDRSQAMMMIDRYHDHRLTDRVFELSWTQCQVLLNQLRATEDDVRLYNRLAGSIIYANPRYRAAASMLARSHKGQRELWQYGISGDLPIVLARVTDPSSLEFVRKIIQAHAYWRSRGLVTDLFIWTDAYSGYRQSLLDEIIGVINSSQEGKSLGQSGGIFVKSSDQLSEDNRLLLQSAARIVLWDRSGSLAEQVNRRLHSPADIPPLHKTRRRELPWPKEQELAPRDLVLFNGHGGFTSDGREYVITLPPGVTTPMPWSNILANERFGSVVTEAGGGYTWFQNANQYRLTPWHNDAIQDTAGEAFYIRDEETGQFWSPVPGPATGLTPYVCRHGLGYSAFEHRQFGIFSELTVYVAREAPVKFAYFVIHNDSPRTRRVSVTGFCEWVLGESRDLTAMHVVTRIDPQSGAIIAANAFSIDFGNCQSFFQCTEADRTVTADRGEFIGRNRSLAAPAAMQAAGLSNRVGAGLDPCAAIQAKVELAPGQRREIVFLLGASSNESEAQALLGRFGSVEDARQELQSVWDFWKHLLGGVYVETPDSSVNFMVNHWLLYQALAGRFWGRSGYYQSGGAYGFRDQLQDAMAFLYECPWLTRQHLIACAGRQFREGDVQHWWHPPAGRGVRTRCSDDYLWLPHAVCRYVIATGDTGILDEQIPFLEGRPLGPGEESYYDMPQVSDQKAALYEHCACAIRYGLKFGAHGLPLIGSGDWNDGFNRVGNKGRGESVWLAFFLYDVLRQFAPLAESRSDSSFARLCAESADGLSKMIETHAWDGEWYRWVFTDDGEPLGSARNAECRISSLPQSWAVLSGAVHQERAAQAMASVLKNLVDDKAGLVKLFDPPFDKTQLDPGYIKGYVPGIRENGGQYTQAAIWAVMALASLRKGDEAWRLFSMINPIRHADTPDRIATYKVEPYVVAADVYTARGHVGRGGWTWYTGSAGWMYHLLVERLLGLKKAAGMLSFAPVLPSAWRNYTIHYRFGDTLYHIAFSVTGAETWNVRGLFVDDVAQDDRRVHLVDDHHDHAVRVEVG